MALQADYKVRIARNKWGTAGEVIRIKFAKGMVPNKLFDRCFVGIKEGLGIYFKLFKGVSNDTSEFDDSKVFRIAYIGEMPGITISSRKFAKYFDGYEGEYDKVEYVGGYDYKTATSNEASMFRLYRGARHNFTNLYKNTSTTVTQKEEEPMNYDPEYVATTSKFIPPYPFVNDAKPVAKKDDSYLDAKTIIKNEADKQVKKDVAYVSNYQGLKVRRGLTDILLKMYFKCLETKRLEWADRIKDLVLSMPGPEQPITTEVIQAQIEQMLKSSIMTGFKEMTELIFANLPEVYALVNVPN